LARGLKLTVAVHIPTVVRVALHVILRGIKVAAPLCADYNLRTVRTAFGTSEEASLFAAYPTDSTQDMFYFRQANPGGGATVLCAVGGAPGRDCP
jgi:hypothetical protein